AEITVWRTSDWHLHRRLEAGAAVVWTVAWTADERLVSGGEDGALRVWDVEDRRCTQAIDAHSGTIARVAPAARSPIVATLGHDERLAVWSLEDGTLLGMLDDAYPGWVGCLDAHPVDDLVPTPPSTAWSGSSSPSGRTSRSAASRTRCSAGTSIPAPTSTASSSRRPSPTA